MRVIERGNITSLRKGGLEKPVYAPELEVSRRKRFRERVFDFEQDANTIVFIAENVYPFLSGGAEISMHSIMSSLGEEGYKVFSVKPGSSYDLIKEVDGVTVIRTKDDVVDVISDLKPFHIFTQLRLSNLVVRFAEYFGISTTVFVRSAAEYFCAFREDRKHVCYEGGNVDLLNCGKGCLSVNRILHANKEVFEKCSNVVCNSEYMKDAIVRFYGRQDAVVQYPTVSQSEGVHGDAILAIRPRFGKGNFVFEELARRMPDRKFVCLGAHNIDLDRVGENVDFVEEMDVKGLDVVFSRCGILIKPNTDMEGFGRIVPEVGSYGIPSICSDIGGLPEALGDGGLLVPSKDFENVNAWISAIVEVEENFERYSKAAFLNSRRFSGIEVVKEIVSSSKVAKKKVSISSDKKIVFTAGDFPGVSSAFKHLADVFPSMVEYVSFSPEVTLSDGLVVFGGWMDGYVEYMKRGVGTFAHSWHSSLTQMEQSGETWILDKVFSLVKGCKYKYVFTSCPEFATVISKAVGSDVARWLPDTISVDKFEDVKLVDPGDGFHVDIFMPAHHRKNLFPQIVAASEVGAVIHANKYVLSKEEYVWFMEAHGIEYVDHGFMPDDAYFRVVAGMDVGLQCSFAESFCYYAVERMLMGIPVLGCQIVPVMRFEDPFLVDHLVVEDPSCVAEISDKLEALKDAELRMELGQMCKEHVIKLAGYHNGEAGKLLKEVIDEL